MKLPSINAMDDLLKTTQVREDTALQQRVETLTQEQAEDVLMEHIMLNFESEMNELVGCRVDDCTARKLDALLDRIRRWISVQVEGEGFRKFDPYARHVIEQDANERLQLGIDLETTDNKRINVSEFNSFVAPRKKHEPDAESIAACFISPMLAVQAAKAYYDEVFAGSSIDPIELAAAIKKVAMDPYSRLELHERGIIIEASYQLAKAFGWSPKQNKEKINESESANQ